MDLSIAKRPCDSVTNKDWEMNAFLPENKRHFLPQDTLATKNHSSHFAPNLSLLSFQIRTCADVIQRCPCTQRNLLFPVSHSVHPGLSASKRQEEASVAILEVAIFISLDFACINRRCSYDFCGQILR